MANKRISQLPYLGNTGYTVNDIMPIVNYDVSNGTTKHTPLSELKSYILSGATSLYEIGPGSGSTQRVDVGAYADGGGSIVSGGYCNTSLCAVNTISGGALNKTTQTGSTISGGVYNTACSDWSTISGGLRNTIDTITTQSGYFVNGSVIGGGTYNTISSYSGQYTQYGNTIAGGTFNTTVSSYYNGQTIGGGRNNITVSNFATIGGGRSNTSSGCNSTVGGGALNTVSSYYGNSTISGGISNTVSSYYGYSTIGGGAGNKISSYDGCSTIAGGNSNLITTCGSGILGGISNTVCNDLSFIVGNGITSTAANTLHINCLNIKDLPDETAIGLPLGTVFYDSTTCNLCVCL